MELIKQKLLIVIKRVSAASLSLTSKHVPWKLHIQSKGCKGLVDLHLVVQYILLKYRSPIFKCPVYKLFQLQCCMISEARESSQCKETLSTSRRFLPSSSAYVSRTISIYNLNVFLWYGALWLHASVVRYISWVASNEPTDL